MKIDDILNQGPDHETVSQDASDDAASSTFTGAGMERMHGFKEDILDLSEVLLDIESFGGPEAEKKAQKLIESMGVFEPSITMIGQIKSGKTSLVNAMVGRPDLLPADVNPWTSVVTSLHLNTPERSDQTVASFQFFNQSEWNHLVENGGRIGELSDRAGAVDELQKVRDQIAEVREKTKTRLGRKFELLLGQTHRYHVLSDDLLQRYVCMGDDFDDPEFMDEQGQFADITKSADLYLDAPNIPMPLCIRDTPGVNDTFMMREQITINALRGSRISVVVLSASQALTAMDMGLIRLISNVKSREVIIFVNRIDELANPTSEIPEIKASILKTLADNNCPSGIEVLFGSAYWANMALQDKIGDIVSDSTQSLLSYADRGSIDEMSTEDVWLKSGVPGLYDAVARRIAEGEGAEMMIGVRKRALNHLHGLRASSSIVSMRLDEAQLDMVDPSVLMARLDDIKQQTRRALNEKIDGIIANYGVRVDQSHHRFLERALESLLQHLDGQKADEVWQYPPDGLRVLLRSSYQTMRRAVAKACEEELAATAQALTQAYHTLISVNVEGFEIVPPSVPKFPPPVTLGQTIALDLQTSWWKGWWRRRKGYRAYADDFYKLIEAETMPIITDLKLTQVEDIRRIALDELDAFVAEQSGILNDIGQKTQISQSELKNLFGITAQEERDDLFAILFDELSIDGETDEAPETQTTARPGRPKRPTAEVKPTQSDEGMDL